MLLERRRMQRAPPSPPKTKSKRLPHQHENKPTPHTRLLSPAWSLCMAAHKKKWPFFIVLACLHSIVTKRVQISSFYEPEASHRPCVAAAPAAWSTEAPPSSVLHRQTPPLYLTRPPTLTLDSPQPPSTLMQLLLMMLLPLLLLLLLLLCCNCCPFCRWLRSSLYCLFVWLFLLIGDPLCVVPEWPPVGRTLLGGGQTGRGDQ